MSIENQATFYFRNVCDYDSSINSDTCLPEVIIKGFKEFSELLRIIYSDWHSYETSKVGSVRTKIGIMSDDLENYHNLTYTLDCLYAIASVGKLCSEGENKYLSVDKSLLKSVYKKSVTFPFQMFEKYCFYFSYFKGDEEVDEYKKCKSFNFYYENGEHLIEAIHFIAKQLDKQEKQKEMPKNVAFMLADYYFILNEKVNDNLLNNSIKNTLGKAAVQWEKLVNTFKNEYNLTADLSFNPYVFPNRTATFKLGKKTICKFGIHPDCLSIRLPLSYEIAKELISNRKKLPQSINDNIDNFHCIACGRCESATNIEIFEGVSLCNLSYSNFVTEDSRCLRFIVTNDKEVEVILEIVKKILNYSK